MKRNVRKKPSRIYPNLERQIRRLEEKLGWEESLRLRNKHKVIELGKLSLKAAVVYKDSLKARLREIKGKQ